MIFDKNTAKKAALALLKIAAVKLNPSNPFQWTSGWYSPIYCDNRVILSYVEARAYFKEKMTQVILKQYGKPDVIAGVATGGIPLGVLVAQELKVPFVYVRASAKQHGRQNQVEGVIEAGNRVVVVEDLISTGKSSLNAIRALLGQSVEVMGLVAVFSYGFDIAKANFDDLGISFITLSDYSHLIEQAVESNHVKPSDLEALQEWRTNPSEWKP